MKVIFPCCDKDIGDLSRLLQWMARLGSYKNHEAIIVCDAATPFDQVMNARGQVGQMFGQARVIASERPVSGWPDGPNSLVRTAMKTCEPPFLWLEPDCVPMRSTWLDEIASAYAQCGKAFMGHIYDCKQPGLPDKVMSGIAVYGEKLPVLDQSPRAWDMDCAEMMVAGAHTPLIHHFWGQPNLGPVFVSRRSEHSPVNALTLEDIPKEAALFHRDKTHSLIRILERQMFPPQTEKIVVCFNVHAGDIGLALTHSEWLKRLGRNSHKAIICHDPSCPVVALNKFEQNLRQCFEAVETFVYPRPPIPSYPASANWAWQSVAFHMTKQCSPWFWFEADSVVLRSDWLEQLQREYDAAGCSWMGPIVQHMGHLQGTAVYPADAALRMPRAMSCGADKAFDMEAHHDTLNDRHDASHLLFHVWTLVNRAAYPVGGGEVPVNITADELRQWLPRSAVYLHRVKDSSVVNLLLRGEFRP